MKKYFYSDGTSSFGPFSKEELTERGITRETRVWFYELGKWEEAGTVPELNSLFALVPPPISRQYNFTQHPIRENSWNKTIEIFVFLAIVYWFIINLINFIIAETVDDWMIIDIFSYFQIGFEF